MITRPLDLSSKLQPPPRGMDWLFFANVGVLVLFFAVFGSRFVLSPGVGADFVLPEVAGSESALAATTHVIRIENAGQIMVDDGFRSLEQLEEWLTAKARSVKNPALLIHANAGVPMGVSAQIVGMARRAGFSVMFSAQRPAQSSEGAPAAR